MSIQEKTVNTIRVLSADIVQNAKSGHPGAPMGMADMAYALWMQEMKHDPKHPTWRDRDRFVLSNGHASPLIYSLLHLCGYNISMDDLKQFRQWGSKTPGHPEHDPEHGIETTTGPLGQGLSNAVGFAIAETMLAAHFNRPGFPIVDHRTFVLAGDGCMMEGITSEASSLAGTLNLSKLVVLYDDNEISIEGDTDIAFREDVAKRYEAYGWNLIHIQDGNDYQQVAEALVQARGSDRPTLIVCPTIIGYGSEAKQGTASSHGEPLGVENVAALKVAFGMDKDVSFHIADDVYSHVHAQMTAGAKAYAEWEQMFQEYAKAYPELAHEWEAWHTIPDAKALIANEALWAYNGKAATRSTSGEMINRLAGIIPNLVGGSADLAPSTKTLISGGGDYSAENRAGRNLHFGVREHAMAAICNGMALHGGLHVYGATFFVFSDYMKGAMRLSAIMQTPVTYVLTHDSIGVGEDGMTHQPIEHLTALRSVPDLTVFRPADGRETTAAWIYAVTSGKPTCLVLTRQNLPLLDNSGEQALKGGYVLSDCEGQPDVLLIATGSEVQLILEAQAQLAQKGISARVVSMPSMELFFAQDKAYQESVILSAVRARVAVEAGATMPWYRLTGLDGQVIGIDRFGASAPAETLFKEYGLTTEHVVAAVEDILA
ncbi:MAG: transketolase [Christensenellales bacterium]|jgi:transketolase